MTRIIYVNGRYVPYANGSIHVEDRGYQFADGVYEVIAVIENKLIDLLPHLDRLAFSLKELQIPWPVNRQALEHIIKEVLKLNRIYNGNIYIQISRGPSSSLSRNFGFPKRCKPSLVVIARSFNQEQFLKTNSRGVKVITLPDLRWKRPDIKSASLLPSVLAKQQALNKSFYDALFVNENNIVTEATSSNVWIVTKQGVLQTHPPTESILNGITRQRLIKLTLEKGFSIIEKPFTVEELLKAQEVFLSSSNIYVLPVVQVDDQCIYNGTVGTLTQMLQNVYKEFVKNV